MIKKGQLLYFGLRIEDNSSLICTTSSELSRFVGKSNITITRWLKQSNPYVSKDVVVSCNELVKQPKRGSAGIGFK
jgi:hypothetical protein